MPSGSLRKSTASNTSENDVRFNAPRPAVTNRLGKKRTEELIQADGDTWQEYLAVCEKWVPKKGNLRERSGGKAPSGRDKSDFLGPILKKAFKSFKKESSNSNPNRDNNHVYIRSYFLNQRTGTKVWDEPPSGASSIIPATEEMRRMAEMQLGELCLSKKDDAAGGRPENNSSSSAGSGSGMNIRYKQGSSLAGPSARSGASYNDRQLQEAIQLSLVESGHRDRLVDQSHGESEDEILRRALEESRLEAARMESRRKSEGEGPTTRGRIQRKSSTTAKPSPSSHSGHQKQPARNQPKSRPCATTTRQKSEGGSSKGTFDPYGESRKPPPNNKQRDRRDRKQLSSSSSASMPSVV